jgi:hypothetical protein
MKQTTNKKKTKNNLVSYIYDIKSNKWILQNAIIVNVQQTTTSLTGNTYTYNIFPINTI